MLTRCCETTARRPRVPATRVTNGVSHVRRAGVQPRGLSLTFHPPKAAFRRATDRSRPRRAGGTVTSSGLRDLVKAWMTLDGRVTAGRRVVHLVLTPFPVAIEEDEAQFGLVAGQQVADEHVALGLSRGSPQDAVPAAGRLRILLSRSQTPADQRLFTPVSFTSDVDGRSALVNCGEAAAHPRQRSGTLGSFTLPASGVTWTAAGPAKPSGQEARNSSSRAARPTAAASGTTLNGPGLHPGGRSRLACTSRASRYQPTRATLVSG